VIPLSPFWRGNCLDIAGRRRGLVVDGEDPDLVVVFAGLCSAFGSEGNPDDDFSDTVECAACSDLLQPAFPGQPEDFGALTESKVLYFNMLNRLEAGLRGSPGGAG
jgi:hypothetical protein